MPKQSRSFSMGYATLSEPVAVDEEKLEAVGRNSAGEQKNKRDSSGHVARKGSLWFCSARSLAGRQKGGISGNRRRPKQTPWEKNVGEVKIGRRIASDRTKERVRRFRIRFGQEKKSKSPAMPQLWPWR